mgnify:CR=1 FL=1
MKRSIAVIVALSLPLAACGKPQYLGKSDGQKVLYPTYGFLNQSSSKSKNVCYEISAGNVIWSIILIETVIAPIYFVGWDLFNPIRMKKDANDDCNSFDD